MTDGDVEVGTKRTSEDYDEYGEIASYKKQRTENLSMRLLMLGRLCGGVIGKSGENIKRLRQEYSVQINVPDTRSKERVLTIVGDRGNCVGCLRDLLPTCTEAPFQVGSKDRGPYEINYLVQSDQVGSLIGKAGAKVKEIRDESNGQIKIYQDCLPNSNERVVALGGEESEILAALDIVLDALREKPKKDISRYYDPKNTGGSMGSMGQGMGGSGGGGGGGRRGGDRGNPIGMGGGLGSLGGGLGGMGGLFGQLSGAGGILGAGIANLWGQSGRGVADQMNGILGSGGSDRRGGQSGGYSSNNDLGLGGGLGILRGRVEDLAVPSLAGILRQNGGDDRGMRNKDDGILGAGNASYLDRDRGLSSRDYGRDDRDRGDLYDNSQRRDAGGQSRSEFSLTGLGQMNNSNSNRGNRDKDNRGRSDEDFGEMRTVTKVTVTNDMCGAIIGKGGIRIRDIRQTSGARVDFSESEKGSKEDREITLTGTNHQVQIAEQLMTQYVRNRSL